MVMTDCTERSEGQEGMAKMSLSPGHPSGTEFAFAEVAGRRTVVADTPIRPAEEVGTVLSDVVVSLHPEGHA
ncbi:hypothetical protein Adu01nite_46910 [Paractinoplanes durhamensis]|uniref:Uncharacterized protein n=1 Tax=Paractinoplanes durhamensis TaxID=113563 RepID=A0ABQ3Z0J1_9ACTN|nr:hypothetical protein Adu01nite_46910 [Actinoplanes durhamensis]